LLDRESEANKKSNQLVEIATKLGAQAYNALMKAIGTCLESKADNLLKRSSNAKVRTLVATFDKPGKQANAGQRKRGKDMPPRLLGYFP
jgi:23S rRNA maturation mini-RNase III